MLSLVTAVKSSRYWPAPSMHLHLYFCFIDWHTRTVSKFPLSRSSWHTYLSLYFQSLYNCSSCRGIVINQSLRLLRKLTKLRDTSLKKLQVSLQITTICKCQHIMRPPVPLRVKSWRHMDQLDEPQFLRFQKIDEFHMMPLTTTPRYEIQLLEPCTERNLSNKSGARTGCIFHKWTF